MPTAVQVSDRFHIIHNFFEAVANFLKRYIGKSIKVIKSINENITLEKETYILNEKAIRKTKLVVKVKELYNSGIPIREIVRMVGISRNTVRKYISIDNVESIRYNSKLSTFHFYKDFIINLLVQGKSYTEILSELQGRGVIYSYSALAKYASELKKSGLHNEMKKDKYYIFTRYNLMKLFWNYKSNSCDVFSLIDKVSDEYPLLNNLFLSISKLNDVFYLKEPLLLEEWITNNLTSEIKEIRSFINGLFKDYDSVVNSILYAESNGTLEGNVNRLKTIKRSMFGRANFNLLRNKVLANI